MEAKKSYHVIDLGLDALDADIRHQMRVARKSREQLGASVYCTIRGFDDDPRELYEIAEVRTFCKRLVDLGFISELNVDSPGPVMGATLVWALAEGLINKLGLLEIDGEARCRFLDDLSASNLRSDRVHDEVA